MTRTCPHCGEATLFVAKAVYDGFTKVGETLTCTACGGEQTPPVEATRPSGAETPEAKPLPSIFSEDDRPESVSLQGFDEPVRMCGHCVHYVVNAFTQRCGLHLREVQATDCCERFERRREGTGDRDGDAS